MIDFTENEIARFWSYVDTSGGPDACWPWKRKLHQGNGNGTFSVGGKGKQKHLVAHRVALWLVRREEGVCTRRSCMDKSCCNPKHLRAAITRATGRNLNGNCPSHVTIARVIGQPRCQLCIDQREKRKERAKISGMCPCHPTTPSVSGYVVCQKCIDYSTARTKYNRNAKMCPGHPKSPAVLGYTKCQKCLDYYIARYLATKITLFNHYGMTCACSKCPHPNPGLEFLSIDHINNDGAEHRKKVEGRQLYTWLIKNNFPTGFQTLCINCNFAKGHNGGVCPHLSRV